MTQFTVYDAETGLILRRENRPNEPTLSIGEAYLLGDYDDEAFYIHDNEAHPLPERPGEWAVFDPAAGVWTDPRTVEQKAADDETELNTTKAKALDAVSQAVRTKRRAYITDLPGQDAIYAAKEAEARAWQLDPAPDPADYPLLSSEVGITAPTAAELATLWITKSAQWRSVAGALEAARMTAKANIAAATDIAGVDSALATLTTAIEDT